MSLKAPTFHIFQGTIEPSELQRKEKEKQKAKDKRNQDLGRNEESIRKMAIYGERQRQAENGTTEWGK